MLGAPLERLRLDATRTGVVLAIVVAVACVSSVASATQLIDRVLAVVAGEPVTLSDVMAAERFGLTPAAAPNADPVQNGLNALIDRQLQLIEVNRYVPPEPLESEITARLDMVRGRFASTDAFDRALKETGVTLPQLRSRIRDDIRIDSYLQQRFGASYQPSEEEVVRYFRTHESDFSRNGLLLPYAEVRDAVRQRLAAERMSVLVRDWVAGLRRRADVTILPK
jgi:hypothetical protein